MLNERLMNCLAGYQTIHLKKYWFTRVDLKYDLFWSWCDHLPKLKSMKFPFFGLQLKYVEIVTFLVVMKPIFTNYFSLKRQFCYLITCAEEHFLEEYMQVESTLKPKLHMNIPFWSFSINKNYKLTLHAKAFPGMPLVM